MKKIILLLATAFALLCLFGSVWETKQLRDKETWPQATGVIDDGKLFSSDHQYWVEIEYHFQANGATYHDESVIRLESSLMPERYQTGSELVVHHHRSDPDRSFLVHPGFSSSTFLGIMGSVMLLACTPFLLSYGLQFYAYLQMRRANRHMRAGMEMIEQIQDDADEILARGKDLPEGWKEEEAKLLDRANEAYDQLKKFDAERDSMRD